MIFETLKILSEEVDAYLDGAVVVENVTKLDDPDGDVDGDVILTLLNIEEEKTLKNFPNNSVKNGRVQYKNPKVNLNLFLLFSGNSSTYTQSLRDISKIIEFFQGKRVFDQSNTTFARTGPMLNVGNFHFTAELYTPSFEELNFIWGTLGGRQLPSVLYKVSIVEIERGNLIGEAGAISEPTIKSKSTQDGV